jgi:ribosomal protein L29
MSSKPERAARAERRRPADPERDLDDQLFRLRIQKAMGQLEAPLKVRDVRRDLARVKTLLTQKQG